MATGYGSPVGGAVVGGFAPVIFTSPLASGAHVDSNIVVEWDFDNDGDFDGTHENITSYVIAAETLSGRDWPSNLHGQTTAGQLRLTLLNEDDRFSYFNTNSPLTQDANSLRTGRKIRVRTAESVVNDPVLLARDHFNRLDAPVAASADELGNTWVTLLGAGFAIKNGGVQAISQAATPTRAAVPVSVTDNQYAQARVVTRIEGSNQAGVLVRATGSTGGVGARLTDDGLDLIQIVASATTVLASYPITPWPGMTIGVQVDDDDNATAFLNGCAVLTDTTTAPPATGVGVFASWVTSKTTSPVLDDFYAWTSPVPTVPGIIWTGDVVEVNTSVDVGGQKFAEVTANGVLARAAAAQIQAPRAVAGAPTGLLVGDVFTRAEVHSPPCEHIMEGSVTTGPVYIEDGDALSLARQFEATELGFIHETPEGPPGFQDRMDRDEAVSTSWWSDTPGVGQFPFSAITPLNYQREVVNRVTAELSASAPAGITLASRVTDTGSFGVANNVEITMPTVNKGDLVVVFIASGIGNAAVEWVAPIWWFKWRDEPSTQIGLRVYDHICDGSESGTTVRFYTDSTASGGSWVAHVYKITDWFKNGQGTDFAKPQPGRTPTPLTPKWGKFPTLYITAFGAMVSFGGVTAGTLLAPAGYEENDTADLIGTPVGAEAGLYTAWRVDVGGPETPSAYSGLDGAIWNEACTYAVRGFNGSFTDPVSIEHPEVFGGEGRPVTRDDVQSQVDHNAVITFPDAGKLFASESDAEAYTDVVLDRYADDRPIIALSFFASKNAQLREQAFTRRVGDKITVTATGSTGLGFERDFFIETIGHRWSNGAKLWEVTWQLSPA